MGKGKGGKGKGKAEPIEEPEVEAAGDEDEEMEEDEYAVEHIVSHRFEPDGTLKLEVKWIGWPDSANTWEPEENLDGCEEEVKTYYDEIGGKPVFGQAKSRKTVDTSTPADKPKSKKRPAEPTSASETPEPKRGSRAKRIKTESKDVSLLENGKVEAGKTFAVPKGSWEDEIISVDTVERAPDGGLIAKVHWRGGHQSEHATKTLNVRCPQKMLQFYEAHLQWNVSQPKQQNTYEPYERQVAAKEEEDSKDVDEYASSATKMLDAGVANLENGIKDVLSSGVKDVVSTGVKAVKSVSSLGTQVKETITKSATPAPSPSTTSKPVATSATATSTSKPVATKAETPASATPAAPEAVAEA